MIFGIFVLAGCSVLGIGNPNSSSNVIKASGSITAVTVQVSPEIGGKVVAINFNKGDSVRAGDVLFKMDDQILQAQLVQAEAAGNVAQANVDMANQKLANAQAQFDQVVQAAQMQDQSNHSIAWKATQASQITLPPWYFSKSEQIAALQAQLAAEQANLSAEQASLDQTLKDASNLDFVAAEKRLLQAQQAYTIANQTLTEAKAARNNKDLLDSAQKNFNSAKSELDTAQKNYDEMLTTDAANNVTEAHARVAVAQETLNNTQDALNKQLTGNQSTSVQVAQTALDEAKTGVAQAQTSLSQAQASVNLLNVQIAKLTVSSPVSGIVLSRPVNAGEVAAAGATVFEIGSLDQVTLDVYIPESQYGQI